MFSALLGAAGGLCPNAAVQIDLTPCHPHGFGRPAAGKQQDTDQIAGRIPWQLLEDGFDLFGSQIVIARCLLVAFDTDRRVAIRPAPFDSKRLAS
jgi:hypothetical protein